MDSHPPPTTIHKPARILACVLCQHRKIKCDRNSPCSNCIKANVPCTPSTPAPPRKRRRPNQDLQERLARCEDLLKEYASSSTPKHTSPPSSSAATSPAAAPTTPEDYLKRSAPRLVQERGNVRFMDNPLWGHLYDELQSMREILDTQERDEDATPSDAPTPDGNSDMLLGDCSGVDLDDLHPDPVNVFRLWHIFLERVNPMTKVLHVPSMQPYFQEAANPGRSVPRNIEALLFAIYAISVVALEDDECLGLLGCSRKEAFSRFSLGVRTALHRLGFLINYDLVTVQALVLYMTAIQGRYDRHACWVMNGVVIRLGQKMGLHRDGETMGLSPFETEIRRRVWWSIILLDAKAALLSGLGHSLLPVAWDTKIPSNINDSDLFPSATEPVHDKDGPTEMIFCLVAYRVALFLTKSPMILQNELLTVSDLLKSPGSRTPHLDSFRKLLLELEASMSEVMEKYCDPSAGALHTMAWNMHHHMFEKISIFSEPTRQPEWIKEIKSPQDGVFIFAVYNVESQFRTYEEAASTGFLWYLKAHFLPDVHAYILSQLCHRTNGPVVDRAWEQVRSQYYYHNELFDMSDPTASSMGVMALRAWRKREAALAALSGSKPETPVYIQRLQQVVPPDRSGSNSDAASVSDALKQEAPQTLESMRWEPMFGGYVDFGNMDWDMFGTLNPDGSAMFPTGPFGGS